MTKIQWRDIAGYEGRYQVSNTGLVKSCEHYHPTVIKGKQVLRHRKEQLLKQWKRSRYLLVDLWADGERDVRSVHILVYEAFCGAIPDGYQVHHKDGNRFNNCVENLECLTACDHVRIHFQQRQTTKKIGANNG